MVSALLGATLGLLIRSYIDKQETKELQNSLKTLENEYLKLEQKLQRSNSIRDSIVSRYNDLDISSEATQRSLDSLNVELKKKNIRYIKKTDKELQNLLEERARQTN